MGTLYWNITFILRKSCNIKAATSPQTKPWSCGCVWASDRAVTVPYLTASGRGWAPRCPRRKEAIVKAGFNNCVVELCVATDGWTVQPGEACAHAEAEFFTKASHRFEASCLQDLKLLHRHDMTMDALFLPISWNGKLVLKGTVRA